MQERRSAETNHVHHLGSLTQNRTNNFLNSFLKSSRSITDTLEWIRKKNKKAIPKKRKKKKNVCFSNYQANGCQYCSPILPCPFMHVAPSSVQVRKRYADAQQLMRVWVIAVGSFKVRLEGFADQASITSPRFQRSMETQRNQWAEVQRKGSETLQEFDQFSGRRPGTVARRPKNIEEQGQLGLSLVLGQFQGSQGGADLSCKMLELCEYTKGTQSSFKVLDFASQGEKKKRAPERGTLLLIHQRLVSFQKREYSLGSIFDYSSKFVLKLFCQVQVGHPIIPQPNPSWLRTIKHRQAHGLVTDSVWRL